jgi:thymidylate kinase
LYQASFDCLESNAILLQEEGFCQQAYYLLFAFRENTSHTQLLERYLQNIPRPDLVVSIVTEADQCESRMQQRAKGVSSDILRFLPVSERIELLAQRLNIYEKIANYLEAQHVEVIRLDNNNYRVSQQMLEDKLSRF